MSPHHHSRILYTNDVDKLNGWYMVGNKGHFKHLKAARLHYYNPMQRSTNDNQSTQSCSRVFNSAPRYEGVLGEWRYSSTHSLTSALDGGEWSASRPGRFTPRETAPGNHWIGGRVGPRAVLDAMKRKIPSPRRESNPRTPTVSTVWSCPKDDSMSMCAREQEHFAVKRR
jgi:hypothetical protein